MSQDNLLIIALSMGVMSISGRMNAQTMSLQQIYELADQQSQQIRVSQTGTQSAGEAVKSARSNLLPDVNVSLSGSYIGNATLMSRGFSTSGTTIIPYAIGVGQATNGKQDTPHWGNSFAVEASQVLYAGGAIKAGIRMAELGEQMASLDVEKSRQEIRFLLTGYYLDLYKIHNQLDVVRQNIQLTEQVLTNMKARHEQGTVLKNDITRYELQRQTLQLTQTQLQDAASILNHQFCTTLHLPQGTIINPDSTELQQESAQLQSIATEETWQHQASSNNVGLQQAGLATQLADQQVKATRADQLPKIALVAEDHLGGPYTSDLIPVNANVNAWFLGVGIKYNLGSIWRKNHDLKKARLNARQSTEQLTLAREGIQNGVQANYTNFLTAYTEVQTQQKQVELADQNYAVVKNRYENQLALLTDMLDASNMKLSADMALVNARINLLYNYYKLKYITSSL